MDPSGISFLFLSVFVFSLSHRANDETMEERKWKLFSPMAQIFAIGLKIQARELKSCCACENAILDGIAISFRVNKVEAQNEIAFNLN